MILRTLLLTGAALLPALSAGEPVAVRYPEGSVHGYLALRSPDGKLLASGDLTQTIRSGTITSRLVYRFKDGSIDDETTVFTQAGHFRLVSDHHIQKGPSFTKPADVMINARSGEVTVRYMDSGKPKIDTSHMDLPNDLSNGILLDLAKNLSPQAPETKISYLAATPKPRLVHLSFKPDGVETFRSAGLSNRAQKYKIHVELGGIAGIVAPIIGKEPEDSEVWIGAGQVTAFIKSESPLFLGGPLLRTELVEPVWSTSNSHPR
ncbi:hypothetical protein [Terriglobus aquaticus]|uniref:DUF3108 domain-containing protein n=1 Tax=Terriglobus aquaticus TaxID=940139 RepID=A0ABW9KNA4_9BACT|nr:hypothetical protein [Terriglobus aquaticus]